MRSNVARGATRRGLHLRSLASLTNCAPTDLAGPDDDRLIGAARGEALAVLGIGHTVN